MVMHPLFLLKRVFWLNLSYNTSLKLHPFHIREDQKNYIVEDMVTGEFFEMTEVCVHAIKLIENGSGLREIEDELKTVYPLEKINIIDFASQLIEMYLVQEVDGKTIECAKRDVGKPGFIWIPQRLGRFFFNRFSVIVYILLFFINIGILIKNPRFLPQYKDIFVFDLMIYNILLYMVISFSLVMIHEFGHVLAMRAVGLPTKINIGHRLFIIVFETDMESVWGLDSKKRNILYLAGISFDIVILFLALVSPHIFLNLSESFRGILGFIIFDVTIRLIYQCCIYMKTDLYYVFENMTGCYNLVENAKGYYKSIFSKNKSKYNQEIFEGEKPVVISYGLFYLIGMAISFAVLVIYFIPQAIYVFSHSVSGLKMYHHPDLFWDGVVMLLLLILSFLLLLYSWRKSYKIRYK